MTDWRRSALRLAVVVVASVGVAACGDGGGGSSATASNRSETSSGPSTSSGRERPSISSSALALAATLWEQLQSAESATAPSGTSATVAAIDPVIPADPRRSVPDGSYVATDDGTVFENASTSATDCESRRIVVTAEPSDLRREVLLDLAVRYGCSGFASAAPTECLGQAVDPVACRETDGAE